MGAKLELIKNDANIERLLKSSRDLIARDFKKSSLEFITDDENGVIGNGKMLRSRMAFRIGPVAGTESETLIHAATAIEMIHTASLLHDDVIDGGQMRRSAPSFWVERGIPGAILLGDFLLFKALDIICQAESGLTHPMVKFVGEMCMAESEQELVQRGDSITWDDCFNVARHKTGSLFAFIGYASAANDHELRDALTEAGYAVGTAYQLADDIMDAKGSPENSGKTLGTDGARNINTAMSFVDGEHRVNPVNSVKETLSAAEGLLSPWPEVLEAWHVYMEKDMWPSMSQMLGIKEEWLNTPEKPAD